MSTMIEEHSRKRTKTQTTTSFLVDFSDAILQEILFRLPNLQSAIQCSLVCKKWGLLVFSGYFQTKFNSYFNGDVSQSLPFTILFAFFHSSHHIVFRSYASSTAVGGVQYRIRFLDFLPVQRVRIKSSSEDLLLVAERRFPIVYYVCNPLTRQWEKLPVNVLPDFYAEHAGIWRDPDQNVSETLLGSYKVVTIGADPLFVNGENVFNAMIYCSKSGDWIQIQLTVRREPLRCSGNAVLRKGELYFPVTSPERTDAEDELTGFLIVDPVSAECRFIKVPPGFGGGWRARKARVCIGVVQGRLRLSQLVKANGENGLKVWELGIDEDGNEVWILKHNVGVRTRRAFVVCFHPNKLDVVFMALNDNICKYNLREGKYEKIGKIPSGVLRSYEKEHLTEHYLRAYPLLHTTAWHKLL